MKIQIIIVGLIFVGLSFALLQMNKTFECSTLKQENWNPVNHDNMTFTEGVTTCNQYADSAYTVSSLLLYSGIGIVIIGFIVGRKNKKPKEKSVKHD